MAWVSVPGLSVRPSRRTYMRPGDEVGARARFVSGAFRSDLELDADGSGSTTRARSGGLRPVGQRSVTLPPATSRRRVTWTASSMRRSWVTSRSVPR
ncbi:hypothetical protein [Streptomyces sp. NPDC001508]|uniref:hypothetical protein n=1 Tax=Streptomyces sp. NPDC001508 TaxID=3154656 RepID=UPI00332225B9